MLLSNGISLRGGIAQGEFFKFNNLMFGPAMVDAYVLETKATNPRIVISDEIIDQVKSAGLYANKGKPSQLDMLILCDKDDSKFFVNYFHTLELVSINHNAYNKKDRIESAINEGLNNEDPSVQAKYIWLDNYYKECEKLSVSHVFNEQIKTTKQNGEENA